MIRQAMVLAAGLGTRMRPLTADMPKPLLPLCGRALLDHALDRLRAAGVDRVVFNAHWQAHRLVTHLDGRAGIALQHEDVLLDTGGAVLAALRSGALRDEPFFVVNGDAYWLDGPTPALRRLADAGAGAGAGASAGVDGALLVHRTFQVHAEVGPGDFALDPWGQPRRGKEKEIVPYVFAGVQLATPALFADAPAGPFSNNLVWDRAIAAGRLRAVVHDGLWFHLSRPTDLEEAEAALQAGAVGDSR